ncbi:GerMN domain-containing protein [Actinomadura barringtoniae]|uniref:GerMN domain-containing protein n=1 Tax=Actinomadura barringtoniae TaxID=1427535 RepID=A0A939T4L8_9ACTN|nr:LpqB family beta-propeller domain-containing protein [Actinomadura barringtoniae]MBO2448404.1 GerMN domain-containing protein [Actinomadura barringtoniae]
MIDLRPALAGAAAVLLACAGCASVPTGGRVVSGKSADRAEQVDDPTVRLIPKPPRPGWGADDIVRGFLSASASFDDDHRVARQYLGGPSVWTPGGRPAVTVFQNTPDVDIVKSNGNQATVRVYGNQLGTITSAGQYAADPKHIQAVFTLGRGQQGWRITALPQEAQTSLLLTKSDVDQAFRPVNLYFFGPEKDTLVPNGIFMPYANRQSLSTQLVQALLGGPTPWLSQAVTSAFPAGTRLLGGVSVDEDKNVATVNLSREASKGDVDDMSAQISWTLRQISEIKDWRLQIAGKTVAPEDGDSTQSVHDWSDKDPDGNNDPRIQQTPYLVGLNGHLSTLQGTTVRDAPPVNTPMTVPAVAPDTLEAAGLSPDRTQVLTADLTSGGLVRPPLLNHQAKGSTFTAPTWDRNTVLWFVETTKDKSWLWTRQRGAAPQRAKIWGLSGREVLAFRIARDGVRAAAIVKVDGKTQIQVGRIAHGPKGEIDAGSFLPVSSELEDPRDLAWRDYSNLVVLGRQHGEAQILPYLVPVSGAPVSGLGNGTLSGEAWTITAAPDAPVLVGTRTGDRDQVCRQRSARDPFSEWACDIKGSGPTYPR